jgi:hypothetical protein
MRALWVTQFLKLAFLTILVCLIASPSNAANEELVYNIMRSSLDTALQNEGFDQAAIDLVHLVGWDAANAKVCGTSSMKEGVIEFAAKKARIPLNILVEKSRAYMDLKIDRIRRTSSDLQYCRNLDEIVEKSN